MTFKTLILSAALITLIPACQQAADVAQTASEATTQAASAAADSAKDAVKTATDKAKEMVPGANISDAPSGIYKAEKTHAYVTFQYWHQGFTRPILRWNEFDATIDLNADAPETSSLSVTINPNSIDSGVEEFDGYLKSADFFDVETYPEITFESTELSQGLIGNGTVTGELTMKGITKLVTLDVKLNKVGENFQSKVPMFGISATASLKRSDWDLGLYTPSVGDDIDITIEVEFAKESE